ncbi:MAG: diaminopimelate epimerase [Lentisphaeria bacterium]|nr:diaminopimelate epimerase [Lentisphaeria bacterium]
MLPDTIRFTKMSAGGNDFVCIDNTSGTYNALLASPALSSVVRAICRRGLGVGADGVVFGCERGDGHGVDIVARFFEPDGSEARLCGNGTACFCYWCLAERVLDGREITILTAAGTARARPNDDDCSRIRVCVPQPHSLKLHRRVKACGRMWTVHTLDTGVPHGVVFVHDVDTVQVVHCGAPIRRHTEFAPEGINVNFTQVVDVGRLRVRTFEFGVEDETLACGTGSTAAAIVATILRGWPYGKPDNGEPVLVDVRGGETLCIWFTLKDDGIITDVCLETRARAIYDGVLRFELHRELNLELGSLEKIQPILVAPTAAEAPL